MPASELPGHRWFLWLRSPTLRLGVLTGIYLSVVFGVWLVVANRVPWTADFAGTRNAVAGAVFVLVMLIPIASYLLAPARLFVGGVTAWTVFTVTYMVMELFFHRLGTRMGAFHVFMLGAVLYGFLAVLAWVASLVLAARHHRITPARRRSY